MVGTKPRRSAQRKKQGEAGGKLIPFVAVPLMLIGVACVLASFALTTIPDKAVWSKEQALVHQKASNKYHKDQFDKSLSEAELAASREAFEAIDQKLSRAKSTKQFLPKVVRWVGIASAGLGWVILVIIRSNQD